MLYTCRMLTYTSTYISQQSKQFTIVYLIPSWYVSHRPLLTVRQIMCTFTWILMMNRGTKSIAVSLKKSLIWIMLSFLTHGTVICKNAICTNPITESHLDGYYCPVDTKTVQLSHVPHHLCTHYCLSVLQYPMFSYYKTKGLCIVHKEICVEMLQDRVQVFTTIISYRPPKQECISWLPYQGNIPEGERLVNMANYYAIRLHYNNEILPGKNEQ